MDINLAYTLGLTTGRGHLDATRKRIVIEFAHRKQFIAGIPRCPKCKSVTKETQEAKDLRYCQNCKSLVKPHFSQIYDQRKTTLESIKDFIGPLAEKFTGKKLEISGNDIITFVSFDFSDNRGLFDSILDTFKPRTSYDRFEIPEALHKEALKTKIMYMKGLADTAGFPVWGNWIPRGKGPRARLYFQIVRNWKLPVQIADFLWDDFKIPTQTIDWGHPNIRDPDMVEYKRGGKVSWSREHQLKIYPECFVEIGFNFYHKQKIFWEVVEHNKELGYTRDEEFDLPYRITRNQYKIHHEGERDKRLPEVLRGKHFDTWWQIYWKLGGKQIQRQMKLFRNPEYVYLTGEKDYEEQQAKFAPVDMKRLREEIQEYRKERLERAIKKWKSQEVASRLRIKEKREQRLYSPMRDWLEEFLKAHYNETVFVADTSTQYLSNFMVQNDLEEKYESVEELEIKPDVVGFIPAKEELAFIEAKDTRINLNDIGQLVGYCLTAKPEFAFLLSPENPTSNLIRIILSNPDVLSYDGRNILIGIWDEERRDIVRNSILPQGALNGN